MCVCVCVCVFELRLQDPKNCTVVRGISGGGAALCVCKQRAYKIVKIVRVVRGILGGGEPLCVCKQCV